MQLILAEFQWFSNLVTLQGAAKYGNLWDKKRISKYVQIQFWDKYMVSQQVWDLLNVTFWSSEKFESKASYVYKILTKKGVHFEFWPNKKG